MDLFEIKQVSDGTFSVAEAIAKSGAMSIFVGGDFIKAIMESGFADDVFIYKYWWWCLRIQNGSSPKISGIMKQPQLSDSIFNKKKNCQYSSYVEQTLY